MEHYAANCVPPVSALFRFVPASGMHEQMTKAPVIDRSREELATILESVGRGDRRAFAMLYQRTSAKLYGICLRLLGSEAEAEDVLQEVYVTVWRKADRFDGDRASPITWLAVLARNKGIDRLRRRSAAVEPLEAALDVEDDSPLPFELVGKKQDSKRLSDCLDGLDDRGRAMIRAAFMDGATYSQLAASESVPLGTMKSWIRRGLKALRGCLEQ